MEELNDVINLLNIHSQRATYDAVGEACGMPAQSVMTKLTMSRRHSFVVAKKNKMPTGYDEFFLDPKLLDNEHVIETARELYGWIRDKTRTPHK